MTELLADAIADGVRFEVLPTELTVDRIDSKIFAAVSRINQSGWALGRYSCEGHLATPDDPESFDEYPGIQVACRRSDLLRLVGHMDDIASEAMMAGELAALHGTILSPHWRAVALCFASPRHHKGDPQELLRSARRRLEDLGERLCSG